MALQLGTVHGRRNASCRAAASGRLLILGTVACRYGQTIRNVLLPCFSSQ
jgi:cyanate permease